MRYVYKQQYCKIESTWLLGQLTNNLLRIQGVAFLAFLQTYFNRVSYFCISCFLRYRVNQMKIVLDLFKFFLGKKHQPVDSQKAYACSDRGEKKKHPPAPRTSLKYWAPDQNWCKWGASNYHYYSKWWWYCSKWPMRPW